MRSRSVIMLGVGLLVVGAVLGFQFGMAFSGDGSYASIKKLQEAFSIINQRYVDDVDTAKLTEEAISGMLTRLDPHSVYIDAERMRDVNEEFNASFEGIGISYEFVPGENGQDTIAVLTPLPGGPSEKAGLLSGDRIIKVGDRSAIGFERIDVEKYLKGRRGTKVTVTLYRPGYDEEIVVEIERDKIPIFTVDAHYMLDENTGYIRINRFARTTYQEFVDAASALKEQGMKQLMLDLRDNAGGYMDMAIRMSDEFIEGDGVIVSARSRHAEYTQESRARVKGMLEDIPAIVLVNEQSASASEIVAGALQDHDRALIIGRRTFGKGLVQKQFPFSDGSVLRMTISRFYTPSGRLIQTPYTKGNREDYYQDKLERVRDEVTLSAAEILDQVPDSLKYKTESGRTVIGGGGILPDFVVPRDSLSPLIRTVLARNGLQPFARQWLDQNTVALHESWDGRRQAFIDEYEVDDIVQAGFLTFLSELDIRFGAEQGSEDDVVRWFTQEELNADWPLLQNLIKSHIGARLFDRSSFYEIRNQRDNTLREAMDRWTSAEDLAMVER